MVLRCRGIFCTAVTFDWPRRLARAFPHGTVFCASDTDILFMIDE